MICEKFDANFIIEITSTRTKYQQPPPLKHQKYKQMDNVWFFGLQSKRVKNPANILNHKLKQIKYIPYQSQKFI